MEPLALHKWKQPVLTPMVGGARSHGNLRFASGDHNPFHRPLPSAVSTEPDRFFTVNHDFINDGYVHEEHHPVYVPCQPVGRWCQCHATHGRWPGAGGSKDPCYTAEQNRQSAIMNAAKMRAMENASNAVKYPAAVALT
jgi:hypothetical protein